MSLDAGQQLAQVLAGISMRDLVVLTLSHGAYRSGLKLRGSACAARSPPDAKDIANTASTNTAPGGHDRDMSRTISWDAN